MPRFGTPTLQPTPARPPFVIEDKGVRYPLWLSSDGVEVWLNAGGGNLRRSLDDGTTDTAVHTFPHSLQGVRQLPSGELLVSTNNDGDIPGEVFRSSGYDRNNPTAATWDKVLSAGTAVRIDGAWGMAVHDNYVLLSEYASAWGENGSRRIYLSTDGADTFTEVFDLADYWTVEANAHLHGSILDPYHDGPNPRLWAINGDSNNERIHYSDDLGASWTIARDDTIMVAGIAMPDCVLFIPDDDTNGVLRWDRTTGEWTIPFRLVDASSLIVIGRQPYRRNEESPVLLGFTYSIAQSGTSGIVATMDGRSFYLLWRDAPAYAATAHGVRFAMGPTASGKIVGSVSDDRQAAFSFLTLDAPGWVPALR